MLKTATQAVRDGEACIVNADDFFIRYKSNPIDIFLSKRFMSQSTSLRRWRGIFLWCTLSLVLCSGRPFAKVESPRRTIKTQMRHCTVDKFLVESTSSIGKTLALQFVQSDVSPFVDR